MEDIQESFPVTKVKRELLDLLRRMEEDQSTIALTRNGEPVGVLMTLERYEALLETIEILSDKSIMRSLAKSAKDFSSATETVLRWVWSVIHTLPSFAWDITSLRMSLA